MSLDSATPIPLFGLGEFLPTWRNRTPTTQVLELLQFWCCWSRATSRRTDPDQIFNRSRLLTDTVPCEGGLVSLKARLHGGLRNDPLGQVEA